MVAAVFVIIVLAFAFYFDQPECRLRGEPPCAEEAQTPASSDAGKRDKQ